MTNTAERRRGRRQRYLDQHGIVSARVRPGAPALVVDISATGALVETAHRLLPGMRVELQLQTANAFANVKGLVVRCAVVRLAPHTVSYRGAIAFDRHVGWLVESHLHGYSMPTPESRPARPLWVDLTREVI